MMSALLLFHFRSGVRVAIRASGLTFSVIAAWLVLQVAPSAFTADLARASFARRPLAGDVVRIAGLAFILAAWGAARLRQGVGGWLRHLPISDVANRRGLLVGLIGAQLPLIVALSFLAMLAHAQGLAIGRPAMRWALVLTTSAMAALPVERRYLTIPLAIASADFALLGAAWQLMVSGVLLIANDAVAGPLVHRRPQRLARGPHWLFHWRIAWRALGVRILPAYAVGLLALGAGWRFATNNNLAGARANSVWRFAGSLACVACIFSLATPLAARRPVWAFARSLPWSARQRVTEDGLFLMGHALLLALVVSVEDIGSFLRIVALLPFLAVRAAGHMRRIPERPTGALAFLAEGFLAASILALLPWTALLWLAGTIPALHVATGHERRLKATRWSELRHVQIGDDALGA